MANKIGYVDRTWNPISGCTPISEGCKNCWAKRMSARLHGRYGYPPDDAFRVTFHFDKLDEPLHWKKPQRVFVCSMGDLFHERVDIVPFGYILNIMGKCPQHTFMLLTKRPQNMLALIQNSGVVLPNVWLGVSVENQKRADERIPILLKIPAAKHFVSVEPLLAPVNLTKRSARSCRSSKLNWVIVGGETGPKARPCKKEWVENLYIQCRLAGVPFWDKQDILGKNIKESP